MSRAPAEPVPLRLGPRGRIDGAPPTPRFRLRGPSPAAVTLLDLGLACCGIEVAAALADHLDPADPEDLPTTAEDLRIVVVAGTVTGAMAPAVRTACGEPGTWVVAYGACADSGGPYWDSYSVVPGAGSLVPVDLYVAGCPPRPEALVAGLRAVVDRARSGATPGSAQ